MAEKEHKYMKLRKHTLSFIVALAVTFMAIETAMVRSAEAIEPPTNLTASVDGNKVTLTWDAASGAIGYKLYYRFGKLSGVYDGSVDVGNVTSQIFENIPTKLILPYMNRMIRLSRPML